MYYADLYCSEGLTDLRVWKPEVKVFFLNAISRLRVLIAEIVEQKFINLDFKQLFLIDVNKIYINFI